MQCNTIQCCGSYGEKSEKKQWKNKKGYIPNHELVKEIYTKFKQYPNVTFYRVVIPKEKMELLSEEVSEVAAWSDIDNIMHIDVNDLWKMLDK